MKIDLRKIVFSLLFGVLPFLLTAGSSHAQSSVVDPSNIGTYVMVDGITSSTMTLAQELDQARAAGLGIVRITFDGWGYIETSSGVFNWSKLDPVVDLITRTYGMDLLFTMPISAPWNLPGGTGCPAQDPTFSWVQVGCTHFPTNNMGLVYRFAYKVAERYRGKIKYYEAWNEPDASFFWGAQSSPNVGEYFNYLKNTYQGIKAADPGAVVLMGGMAFPSQNAWINSLMALGAANYMDAMNVHYYQLADKLDDITNNIKKVQSDFGFSKPVWITETSRTGAQFPTSDRDLEEHKKSVFLMEMLPQALGGIYSKIFWHTLRNPVGYDFALADTAGNPFPAYTMMQKFTERFGGTSFVSVVSTGPLHGWRFKSDSKDIYMFYSDNTARLIAPVLPYLPDHALLTDSNGNEIVRRSADIFSTSVGQEPVFLSVLPDLDIQPPEFNAGLLVRPVSPTSISLAWRPATDNVLLMGYELDIAKNPNFVNCVEGYDQRRISSTGSSLMVSGLQPRTPYYVRMRAYDAFGNMSDYSSPAWTVTPPGDPNSEAENIMARKSVVMPTAAGPEPVVFGPEARHIEVRNMRGQSVYSLAGDNNSPLIWNGRDSGGRSVESGAYLVAIKDDRNNTHYQVIVVAK